MSSPSVSYAESVLSHLERVQQLPVEIQVGIARRVESCIKIARAAKNEVVVANIASSAMEEQAKAIGHGTMEPQWAAPAIAEAWCCHDEPLQGLPRSIARASHHRCN